MPGTEVTVVAAVVTPHSPERGNRRGDAESDRNCMDKEEDDDPEES